MNIKTEYDIEDVVFLKHDPDQLKRMIVEISVSKMGYQYCLLCGTEESWHYEFELAEKKNVLQKFQ